MLPQIIKTYRTKSVSDISIMLVVTYAASMLLWVIYAYFIGSWPIIITNGIAFAMGIVQLAFMLRYSKNR